MFDNPSAGPCPGDKPIGARAANYFGMTRAEFHAATVLALLLLGFKTLNLLCFRFDTDESQHMHVIWSVAHNFVQYRDVFDNHMPLFHLLLAPLCALFGDDPAILFWGRFLMLLMYFVAVWCTYEIGRTLFSRRVGVWAVVLAGFYPVYHFTSFEFRTDNVWAPLWLLCVLVLISGPFNPRRAAVAGMLMSLCFGISAKSVLLLIALAVAATITLLLVGREKLGKSWRELMLSALTFVGVTAIVPLITLLFVVGNGLWAEFRYCVFEHNLLPHFAAPDSLPFSFVILPVAFPLVVLAARKIASAAADPATGFIRTFVFLVCGFYLPALFCFWKLITRQDFLPYHPLAFVFIVAGIVAITERRARAASTLPWLTAFAAIELLICVITRPFWFRGARLETELVRDVLKLTGPGEYVFDCKGESIFRQRSLWPVYEPITMERIRRGLMTDDAAQKCIDTRTCVAAPGGGKIPADASAFVMANYVAVRGWVRVVGGYLRKSGDQPGALEFDTVIPATYRIISAQGNVNGMLDEQPCDGARFLQPGKHRFVAASPTTTALAFVWARAVEMDYSPFHYVAVCPLKT